MVFIDEKAQEQTEESDEHGAAEQLDDDLLACTQESEELEVYAACHPRHLGG